MIHPSSSRGVKFAVTIMCLVWGSTWFVVREGLGEMQPFGSGGMRFFLAWVLMLGIAPVIARREGGERPTWRLVLVMATGNFAISYGIVYWAEQTLPSGLTAVLWAVFPLMTAGVAQLQGTEARLRSLQWWGLVVGFLGVILLFLTDVRSVGGDAIERGLVLLLSPLVSAFATAYIKQHGANVSAALLNRSALLVGSLMLLVAALLVEGGVTPPSTPAGAMGVIYLSLFGTVLTFTLYFWVLRQASTVSLSLIAYVTPAIALVVGASLGEETVTAWTLGGLVLVLIGCSLVLRKPGASGVEAD